MRSCCLLEHFFLYTEIALKIRDRIAGPLFDFVIFDAVVRSQFYGVLYQLRSCINFYFLCSFFCACVIIFGIILHCLNFKKIPSNSFLDVLRTDFGIALLQVVRVG